MRRTNLYSFPIDEVGAQILVDQTCKAMSWNHVPIVKFSGLETTKMWGTFTRSTMVIRINQLGENYGTVLHELTHLVANEHGYHFKAVELELWEMWE